MNNEVSKGTIAVIAVAVALVLIFIGWKTLGPGSKGGGGNPYANAPQKAGPGGINPGARQYETMPKQPTFGPGGPSGGPAIPLPGGPSGGGPAMPPPGTSGP